MNRPPLAFLVLLVALCDGKNGLPAAAPRALKGYIREVQPESSATRESRHRKIAERRTGPIVIVHRGASAFAPENTLEAYAAAMDYGADGCEVDLRRTLDGVLVLFHDDMLDHLTDGFGTVSQLTYFELLLLKPQFLYGTATAATRPPTFAALLELARHRAMLLHLDVKEMGLEDEIAKLLDVADAWDHIVAVNNANAPKLLQNPKFKPLKYKGPGLYEYRRDFDPEAVRAQLARPGAMLMVDDPRVAARELKRPPYQPMPLLASLRETWRPAISVYATNYPTFIPAFHLRTRFQHINLYSAKQLLSLFTTDDPAERAQPDGEENYQRRRTERIVERAWAAQQLGQLGHKSSQLVKLLEFQIKHRTLHRDWMYHGLDGALAVRSLAKLDAVESVPVLIEAFLRIDPELKKVANPEFKENPLSWTDWRTKLYILPALGELRRDTGKIFLLDYLALDETKARELSPPQFEEATKAVLRYRLNLKELNSLLRSPHLAVRGTAILECLDHPTRNCTAALKDTTPWALALPRARR